MAELTRNDTLVSSDQHPDYYFAANLMRVGRDCLEGEPRIKEARQAYLKHPSDIDTDSTAAVARYDRFIDGAEYDNAPAETKRSLLGKMRIADSDIELPERIEYLADDCDGDGRSLVSAIQSAVGRALMNKYDFLVVDYQGLGDADLDSVTIADVRAANPRAKIKQYSRENVVDWNFARINGVMQLEYIKLLERGYDFDKTTGQRVNIESYLILALDDDGNYYQQKEIFKEGVSDELSEPSYVSVSGSPLKWLPVFVVADEYLEAGEFPRSMGYLFPICLKSLDKYRVSAVYKEVQRSLAPTTFTGGWKEGDAKIFKEANNGREYIATGPTSVNNLPEGVTVDIVSGSAEMGDFQWYFDATDKKIRAMGGSVKSESVNMTATEADINATDQNAMLESLAHSTEEAFIMACQCCAMFEGLVSPDNMQDLDVSINLPRDFATPRLTVDEVRVIFEGRTNGAFSHAEMMRQLQNGGWLIEDIETVLAEMEMDMGDPVVARPVDSVNESVQNDDNPDDEQDNATV